jgi:tungstate transport system substrate-binding protein
VGRGANRPEVVFTPRRDGPGNGRDAEYRRSADQKRAYTLTDRGTYLAQRQWLDLVILFEGDARLKNVYRVYAVNPVKHPKAKRSEAQAFIDFLVSAPVQQAIAAFKP